MKGVVVVVKTFHLLLVHVPKKHLIKITEQLARKKKRCAHMIIEIIVVDKQSSNATRGQKARIILES